MEQLEDYADQSLKLAEGFGAEYCDVRAEHHKKEVIHIENGAVEHIKTLLEGGIGI
nr:TldD/PmbA family protein [Nitrosopumilaceae archaeon]NIU86480.1 TldD/PmbA family protein [Nitrosopumilaceae archaeon]NIV65243.1 TldD/PmbA family protein [Nitrosopumilaceae archaeon]NIX60694.1 TldD/PmbA family protein [Nitrosopumilaceae archaeon]